MRIRPGINARFGKRIRGGVHPPDNKHLTAEKPIVRMQAPELVTIPLRQHIGAPCSPRVERGDRVLVGTVIGDSEAFVSAPVHSSVSGTVRGIAPHSHPAGGEVPAVIIENDGEYERDPSLRPLEWQGMEPEKIRRAVRAAGMVGLGGAAFPTHVKLAPPKEFPIDTVILNGAECEPFLTADYRLMLEHTEEVVEGLRIIMKAVGAPRAIIAVEDNKPLAVKRLAEVVRDPAIELRTLRTRYPQGAEKVLITNLLGREVPSGGLPMHVGVVVNNVGTAQAIAHYFRTGVPLVERVVTVTGSVIREPSNLLVPLGTSFAAAVEACGGFTSGAAKVIMGGPMMGLAQWTLEVPVVKGTSGILALSDREVSYEAPREPVCIRCGRCVEACPMNLVPTYLAAFSHRERWEEARRLNINDCIECGCCTYACPTRNPIVQLIKFGKAELARLKAAEERRAREREAAERQGD